MKKHSLMLLLMLFIPFFYGQSALLYESDQNIFLLKPTYIVTRDYKAQKWVDLENYIIVDVQQGTEIYDISSYPYTGFGFIGCQLKCMIPNEYLILKCSKSFLDYVTYKTVLADANPRWVPLWYFEALKKKNRDLIIKAEPKRLEWAADILPDVWYKDIPQVASVVLSNTGMTFYTPLETKLTGFLFGELKQINETTYEATAYPELQDTNELISWEPYKQNFPLLAEGKPVQFRYEIIGKTMKIYNAANNKIVFDLIQMPYEWVKLYEEFIRTNKVPVGLNIPEEYQKQ